MPAAPAGLYGLVDPPQLVSINTKTGVNTAVGPAFADEGEAQQLSSIDAKNQIYFIVGYNFTTNQPNLMGLSLTTG